MQEKEYGSTAQKTQPYFRLCLQQNGAYFITICTQDRKRILSTVGTGVLDCPQIQLLPHGEIADKYIRQLDDFYGHISVDQYVIMPDHIHILLAVQNA